MIKLICFNITILVATGMVLAFRQGVQSVMPTSKHKSKFIFDFCLVSHETFKLLNCGIYLLFPFRQKSHQSQQLNLMPPEVGQHSPVSPRSSHFGLAAHELAPKEVVVVVVIGTLVAILV